MTRSVLIIYTGGTIGMIKDPETGVLAPFDFEQIQLQVPELNRFGYDLDTISFDPLIDSSNLNPSVWTELAELVAKNYNKYDGFVVLHGTDTMAYSASALSFMLENLSKPIIFTGSQLPIGTIRTDGKENLITAVEIAAAQRNGQALVPEVCVYFENKLLRGNRTSKHSSEHFNAFESANYPALAEAGINLKYNYSAIQYPVKLKNLQIHRNLDTSIAILRLFPGITQEIIRSILGIDNLKAVILGTYGAGNAPTSKWFIDELHKAVKSGVIILNVTQCQRGSVDMEKYHTGNELLKAGVVSGFDITIEAAVAKLMHLLGTFSDVEEIKRLMGTALRGEITK